MNAEDIFIADILAVPVDDAARLEYADWLQNRGDPRGEYLCAEMEWSRGRADEAEALVREMAAKLDPVWVARVSRPPVGVCSNHVRFLNGAGDRPRPRLGADDLVWVEAQFRLTFPPDYRAFLLHENGGIPEPSQFRIPGRSYREGSYDQLGILLSIWAAKELDIDNDGDLVWRLKFLEEVRSHEAVFRDESLRWRGQPHGDLMVIGYGPAYSHLSWVCLGCRRDVLGKVYHVAPYLMTADEEDYCLVAPTFAAFLGMLTDYNSETCRTSRRS